MRSSRFFWKLFLANAALMGGALVAAIGLIVFEVDRFYRVETTRQLAAQAQTIRELIGASFESLDAERLGALAREIGDAAVADLRVTFVAADGKVLGDSRAAAATMDSHADRPEIIAALRDGAGVSERFSDTLKRQLTYAAVRIGDAQDPLGVVRVARPEHTLAANAAATRRLVWTVGAITLAASLALAWALARFWSAPLRRITQTARNLSRGDLDARVDVGGVDELAELAHALNQMRGQMQSQLGALERQRRRLDELIRNLTEGVIVCDTQGRVVLLNPTAARMLNLRGAGPGSNGAQAAELCRRMVGKPVEHCVSQRELQQLLAPDDRPAASADGGRREGAPWVEERRVTIPTQRGDVALLARVSDIELSEHDRSPGARSSRLMVLTDITTLQRTIQMKTDFVANASHELRTPLSAIRAAVETLSQMPLSDEPDGARRFLTMIDRHCGRLEELLRDLLDLSRVESTADAFETTRVHLPGLLEELRTRFAAMLESKGIELRIDCAPPARSLRVSARLLALTVGNLLENAIKFSEPGGQVRILSRRLPAAVSVAVEDDGCGIPADEHDRIFERFYQVKQTRATSGDGAPALRGSGLGLSIVKHAVVAMKGELQLDSAPGRGTRVSFTIPQ